MHGFTDDRLQHPPSVRDGAKSADTVYAGRLETWHFGNAPPGPQRPNVQHGLDFEPVAVQRQRWHEMSPEGAVPIAQVRVVAAEQKVDQHNKELVAPLAVEGHVAGAAAL